MKSVNEIFNDDERFKKSFDINDIEAKNPFYVDKTADWLVRELGNENYRSYYCKLAREIPKFALNNMLIRAKGMGRDPSRLFTHLSQKYLKNKGRGK